MKLEISRKTKEYKTIIESAIFFYLQKLNIEYQYKNFNIIIESPKINDYRFFYPRFIIYYNHIDFSKIIFDEKNKIEDDIKFIFSSPWIIKKLFNIVCKLKKI